MDQHAERWSFPVPDYSRVCVAFSKAGGTLLKKERIRLAVAWLSMTLSTIYDLTSLGCLYYFGTTWRSKSVNALFLYSCKKLEANPPDDCITSKSQFLSDTTLFSLLKSYHVS